jgi:ABC-2 type transport system permease protein
MGSLAYYSLVAFFAGQMVPLWLFPQFLRVLAEALPFQSVYYIPLSIYTGTLAGEGAVRAIGLQALWAVFLVLISRWKPLGRMRTKWRSWWMVLWVAQA